MIKIESRQTIMHNEKKFIEWSIQVIDHFKEKEILSFIIPFLFIICIRFSIAYL
jgi:hypothetical protein